MNSADSSQLIDIICDGFESDYRAGKNPQIENYLKRVPRQLRSRLSLELLLVELERRTRGGEAPQPDDYRGRLDDQVVVQAFQRLHGDHGGGKPWVHEILRSCPALRGLPREVCGELASRMSVREYAAGGHLMREGRPSSGLHLLLSGVVEIRSKSHVIDRSGRGAVVGEISLLADANCTADVVAIDPVRALVLPTEDYWQLREKHKELDVVLGNLVADRLGSRDWDALCGKSLKAYNVLCCLRRGGMGVVYEARTPGADHSVALKMLRHCLIHDSSAVTRFEREGEFLKTLRHDNIVAVHDVFVEYRTLFFVMDLCDGDDLGSVLNEAEAPPAEDVVRRLLGQVAAGLQHAHETQIVHLDIKPSNILINRDGTVKLCDFGLSRMLGSEASEPTLAGTPRYMAPEQLSALTVGPESDWYGLGCVAYEMLAGRPLFDNLDLLELSSLKAAWRPPADWDLPASEQLKEILRGALRPLPEHRQLDLAEVASWAGKVPELLPPAE